MDKKRNLNPQLKTLLKWLFLLIILIAAAVLYKYKINGSWDYTANFNIRKIEADYENYNIRMVIDNDLKTSWGELTPRENSEDSIKIEFIDENYISGVYINYTGTADPAKDIEFSFSSDGETWRGINGITTETDSQNCVIKYNFNQSIELKYLKFTHKSHEQTYWVIAELGILYE